MAVARSEHGAHRGRVAVNVRGLTLIAEREMGAGGRPGGRVGSFGRIARHPRAVRCRTHSRVENREDGRPSAVVQPEEIVMNVEGSGCRLDQLKRFRELYGVSSIDLHNVGE